ncbi:MAG: response regulator transcription factor [Dehalococcoidales bacterium]|nr:response regulator transcription factor [Dehalococcoidales bacterium]
MKIVIIEDNNDIVSVVSLALQIRWPDVVILSTGKGEKGLSLVADENPDIVILDIGLPDMDGFDVLKKIRLFSMVSVIILTARDKESDIIMGLESGADDYIIKPFRQLELISRVNAILRRQHIPGGGNAIQYKSLLLQPDLKALFVNKKKVNLTQTEGVIMYHLLRNAEKIIPISNLAEAVWNFNDPSTCESIRVYIHRLRNKIEENPKIPYFIHTKAGVGYILKVD